MGESGLIPNQSPKKLRLKKAGLPVTELMREGEPRTTAGSPLCPHITSALATSPLAGCVGVLCLSLVQESFERCVTMLMAQTFSILLAQCGLPAAL